MYTYDGEPANFDQEKYDSGGFGPFEFPNDQRVELEEPNKVLRGTDY